MREANPYPRARDYCEAEQIPYCPFYGLPCERTIWCPEWKEFCEGGAHAATHSA